VLAWQLTAVKATTSCQVTKVDVGDYVEGCEIRGEALAASADAPFARGALKATLSAFRPDEDLPGQRAGLWHVRVKWTITDAAADPAVAAVRHNPHVLAGDLFGSLKTNPATDRGALALTGKVPRAFIRNRWWTAARASFVGQENLEGTLTVSLK
jgi:hypothetical protein